MKHQHDHFSCLVAVYTALLMTHCLVEILESVATILIHVTSPLV